MCEDIIAGITVAIIVTLALAFGQVSQLGPIAGILGAIAGVYGGLFGGCIYSVSGPQFLHHHKLLHF